jgi:uncharacterized phage infection (PIP) family protein YhgE
VEDNTMADIGKVRSAYAFFQGKRTAGGGEQAAVQVPIQPKPAQPQQPTIGGDQLSTDTAKVIAELERRIGELEKQLKEAKEVAKHPTVATPPINPVPNQTANDINKGLQQVTDQINQADAEASKQIQEFNDDLTKGINKVNREIARVNGQMEQVNKVITTQIPAITTQVNQTVNAFKGLFDSFKNIKF